MIPGLSLPKVHTSMQALVYNAQGCPQKLKMYIHVSDAVMLGHSTERFSDRCHRVLGLLAVESAKLAPELLEMIKHPSAERFLLLDDHTNFCFFVFDAAVVLLCYLLHFL